MDVNDRHARKVEQATLIIIDCNNCCSDELVAEGIVQALVGSHRTLQASFVRSLREALKQYSETAHTDARNEGAVEWAKEVSKIDGAIPFI